MSELINLQEFSSMNYCVTEIPVRVRRGFTITEVQFTCIDAVDEYITIGTNIGIVYWCNRSTNKIERLRPEKYGPKITYVRVISSVDYMVAAGDESGAVTIFTVPKEKLFFLLSNNEKSAQKSIERFSVSNIHFSPITTLEWSLNGQKLFSGDEKGLIVYTQMDFNLNIVKSTELLNEKFPIVQLSYHQPHLLLIASEYRCLICNQGKDNKTVQVGQKERLNLCKLGAVTSNVSSKPVIYSARPKQRIWLANAEGNVEKTLLFKEALSKDHSTIRLRDGRDQSNACHENPLSTYVKAPEFEFNFLKRYKEKFMLAYNSSAFTILNTENNTVEGGLYTLKKINSVAVNKDEIFILESHRKIRRLATNPDKYEQQKTNILENKESPIGEKLLDIVCKIKEEASTSMMKPVLQGITKINPLDGVMDLEPIIPGEDALLTLTHDDENQFISRRNVESNYVHEDIIEEDVALHRKKKRFERTQKPKLNILDFSSNLKDLNLELCNSGISEVSNNMNDEYGEDNESSSAITVITPSKEIPDDILPDFRHIDRIMEDVKCKESRLAELLNISSDPEITPSWSNPVPINDTLVPSGESNDSDIISPKDLLNNSDENLSKNQSCYQILDLQNETFEDGGGDKISKENEPEQYLNDVFESTIQTEHFTENMNNFVQISHEDSWLTWYLPTASKWICVTKKGLYYGGPKSTVYYSETEDLKLTWKVQHYRATKMSVSLSGFILWKIDLGVAYAFSSDLMNRWKTIARNVESIAVNENSAWYVSDGNIHVQLDLSPEEPFSEKSFKVICPEKVSKIYCFENTVWALTKKGKIFCNHLSNDFNPLETQWKNIPFPENLSISHLALGCKGTGWIVTNNNQIYFTDNFLTSEEPDWWQITLNDTDGKKSSNLTDPITKFVHWSRDRLTSSVVSSDKEIWILRHNENILQVNRSLIKGHRWVPFHMEASTSNLKWKSICGTGNVGKSAVLWCLSTNNDLFLLHPLTKQIRGVGLPSSEDIICLSASFASLWVLTKTGEIYSRLGISDENQYGSLWKPVTFKDANNLDIKFQYLSFGLDVIWAIDIHGKVFCAVGSPIAISRELQDPDLIHIKDVPSNDVKFTKVVVGPHSYMVWALDQKCNVYVRQGIFFDFLYGTAWIQVSGIKAVNLVISSSAVWALTSNGNVYCRYGISQVNYIGDYWLQIPDLFALITISSNEGLWGVSSTSGHLNKYETHVLDLLKNYETEKKLSETTDEEWEII